MKINDILDERTLEIALLEGYVSKRKHPELDLYIYNYTSKTQIEWAWDRTTVVTRGLIVNGEGEVISRPFKKFFTLDQLTSLRNHVHNLFGIKYKNITRMPFRTYDKVDGSLGVAYPDKDGFSIATRGSFESDQAKEATKILKEKYGEDAYSSMVIGCTYLFEIIYPDNRIVVNYGEKRDLHLLAVIDNETGLTVPPDDVPDNPFPAPQEYDVYGLDELEMMEEDNKEGFVLWFPESDFRLKFKFEEYKRLHKILTNVNEKNIWQMLRAGDSMRELLDNVPDEFYNWVQEVSADFKKKYKVIDDEVRNVYKSIKDKAWTKKDVALYYKDYKYRSLLFTLMDGKDSYEDQVWKLVKPEREEIEQ